MNVPHLTAWFYLHTNGEIKFKNHINAIDGIRESDFCHTAWPWNGTEELAWLIIIESTALKAKPEEIKKYADEWKLNDETAPAYAEKIGVELGIDGNMKTACKKGAIVPEDAMGFGETYIEAMAALALELGFKGGKEDNRINFADLVRVAPGPEDAIQPQIGDLPNERDFDTGTISKAKYIPETQVLQVTFKGGALYEYYGVPADIYHKSFGNDDSFGVYLGKHIKGHYTYEKK